MKVKISFLEFVLGTCLARSTLILALAAGLWLCAAPGSHAATLTVTNPGDSGNGSLRDTIAAAGSGDTIVFNDSLAGHTILLTSGQLSVDKNLVIDASALTGGIAIDAQADSSVLEISAGAVVLNSTSLTNGFPGVVVSSGATLTLSHCTVFGCVNIDSGAGIDNEGTLLLNDCVLSNNVSYASGGSLYNNGTATVNRCTFSYNYAPEGGGGGIYNEYSMTLLMTNCVVGTNTAADDYGGALNNAGNAFLDHCNLTGNGASGGGGIFNSRTLGLNACTVSSNVGYNQGGGGILTTGDTSLYNCTVSGNTIYVNTGGGILASNGVLSLTNCTVSNNSAPDGGGIYNIGSNSTAIHLMNTIVAGNVASSVNDIYGAFSGPNNFVGGDPQLAPLGNYGGITQTMPPLPGSPVIDAGSDIITNILATDQRGVSRLVGLHVDIGAVEAVYSPAAVVLTGAVLGNRSFQLNFTNYPNMSFRVFATADAALPFSLWSNLGPVAANPAGSGQYQFTDLGATNSQRRFYRVTSP